MKLLIVGYSKIVEKKVLPALAEVKIIDQIDVASVSRFNKASNDINVRGKVFDNYEEAFEYSKAEVVYVSTINSLHGELSLKALEKGFHVIVDKPSFLTADETRTIVSIAKSKNLCLAEASVFAAHPQVEKVKTLFKEAGSEPEKIVGVFTIPPFPDIDNFRYIPKLGGGVIYDLGPYAMVPGRVFFESEPINVKVVVTERHQETDVDIAFSVLATYPKNKVLIGHFGFNGAYYNQLTVLGKDVSIDIPVPFTTPFNLENTLNTNIKNVRKEIVVEAANSFSKYFEGVLTDIKEQCFHHHLEVLISDAKVMQMIKKNSNEY
jgi:predicted dehydrogenase